MFTQVKIFLLILLVVMGVASVFVFSTAALAQSTVPVPKASAALTGNADGSAPTTKIHQYIIALVGYGVQLAGLLAIMMITAGGFMWMTAGGQPGRVETAKDMVRSALLGLLLALFAYTILQTINPRLVDIQEIKIDNSTTK